METYLPGCTLRLFRRRIDSILNRPRGLHVIQNKEKIAQILIGVLGEGAKQLSEPVPGDSLWWFRGYDSMYIYELNLMERGAYQLYSDGWHVTIDPQFMLLYVDDLRPDTDFFYLQGMHYSDLNKNGSISNSFIAPKESRLNNVDDVEGEILEKSCPILLSMNVDDPAPMLKFLDFLYKFPSSGYHRYLLKMDIMN